MMEAKALLTSPRYSLYLFYWYKSTNTNAEVLTVLVFSGTRVQILTLRTHCFC
jgi:hypothetical protein